MTLPLCRYCNKPMKIKNIDLAFGIEYECDCDGSKEELELKRQIDKKYAEINYLEKKLFYHSHCTQRWKRINQLKDELEHLEKDYDKD